jgi:hypothetical protein
MAALPPLPQQPQQQEEGVIEGFTNEGEGWLGECARAGYVLAYSGGIAAGKAEGRGTVHSKAYGWTLSDADFRGGRMLPCRAVFAVVSGDAFAGLLAAGGRPANGARGTVVRGADGGRFQGEWPAAGADYRWFRPRRGAAWDARDGRVWPVALDGRGGIGYGGSGWAPGGAHAGWGPALGVMDRPTARQVRPDPPRPPGPHAPHGPPRRATLPPRVIGCIPTAITARAPIQTRAAAGFRRLSNCRQCRRRSYHRPFHR